MEHLFQTVWDPSGFKSADAKEPYPVYEVPKEVQGNGDSG